MMITDQMLNQGLGSRMSLRLHFLHYQMSLFPEDVGTASDEQGKIVLDISEIVSS